MNAIYNTVLLPMIPREGTKQTPEIAAGRTAAMEPAGADSPIPRPPASAGAFLGDGDKAA